MVEIGRKLYGVGSGAIRGMGFFFRIAVVKTLVYYVPNGGRGIVILGEFSFSAILPIAPFTGPTGYGGGREVGCVAPHRL